MAGCEGVLFRRRYLQYPEGPDDRTLRQAEAAGADVVLHFTRDDRLRNSEGDEGSRMPAADCGLRVGRPPDFEKHQEGRDCRAGAAVHKGLP